MGKTLVIVESPAKSKTIEKFLGKDYMVAASMGHLRDLPKSQFGVDVKNNYEPRYINISGKSDLIKKLKALAAESDKVLLATDPDREGEAIAWHLAHILGLDDKKSCRVEFNEITKNAITEAIKHPRKIDLHRVDAQQTRRILDRIVGYKLSPLLWKKVRRGLSAGRVQTVAVKIICDREREFLNFVPKEYWSFSVLLSKEDKQKGFVADLQKYKDKKVSVESKEQADELIEKLKKVSGYDVSKVERKEKKRKSPPPFTTSSLQQEAVRKLGFTTKKTMMVAQQLYEGLDLGEYGSVGLITYMRTDSLRISTQAVDDSKEFILDKFGKAYYPAKPNVYSSKNNAQDAHEAIRPSDVQKTPDELERYLNKDQYRLYKLIWERFLASQMMPAVFDSTEVTIKADDFTFKSNGSKLIFSGFLILDSKKDLDKDTLLPDLEVGNKLKLKEIKPAEQHFTEPPPRYNEATLVKALEELGIGRPSTYSPIIQTILDRGYVKREEKKIIPTDLGFIIVELLGSHFQDIIDENFTASLEGRLDGIAEGKDNLVHVLDDFYNPFTKLLNEAEKDIHKIEIKPEVSKEVCDKCGALMVVKSSRYGNFLACPNYPTCKNTKPIINYIDNPCPICGGKVGEFKTKKGRKFYKCTKEGCSFINWNKPSIKKCATCGSYMVEKTNKSKQEILVCSNEECGKEINK